MTTYIIAILSLMFLCVFWALLQDWLNKQLPDPGADEEESQLVRCQGCETQCGLQDSE